MMSYCDNYVLMYSSVLFQVTYCTHIIEEIISTEKRYVKDLTDIIEVYIHLIFFVHVQYYGA